MHELTIDADLVGKTVRNAARPDWGDGQVLQVHATQTAGQAGHRVQVHFARTGTRWLLVPPARLVEPGDEPTRAAGWIEQLGKSSLDDKLRRLSDESVNVIGSLRERVAAVVALYAIGDEPRALLRWAIDQTGVTDPLSHWSRDELGSAFRDFCVERDSHLRNLLAQLKMKEGPDAVRELLDELPAPLAAAVREALSHVI